MANFDRSLDYETNKYLKGEYGPDTCRIHRKIELDEYGDCEVCEEELWNGDPEADFDTLEERAGEV